MILAYVCQGLCYITKISKIESNSQLGTESKEIVHCCVISQRYPKLKAIHNLNWNISHLMLVVLYHKDIQN